MKRKVFLAAIAVLMLAASCGKEDGDDSAIVQQPTTESVSQTGSQNEEETVATTRPIVIRATKGESLSKVSSSDGHTLTFEAGDKLTLKYADDSECITLEMDGDYTGQTTATFKGNIPTAADGKYLYAEIGSALTGVASSTTSLADVVSTNCYMKSAEFTYDANSEITNVFLSDQNAYIAISLCPFSKTTSVTVNTTNVNLSEYKQVWVAVNGGTKVSISDLSVSDKTTVAGKIYKVNRNAFSVSDTKKVHFSKGNLQATATVNGDNCSWTWGFAANQYDYLGAKSGSANTKFNNKGTVSQSGIVDLFGWVGASSEWTGAAMYGVSSYQYTNQTFGYGTGAPESLKSDWGNVPGIGTGWSTLTGGADGEWKYLLDTRTTTSNVRYARAKVAGVNGLIIVPDDWSTSTYNLQATNSASAKFTTNTIDATTWSNTFESAGAVFLPAAGYRYDGSKVNSEDYLGYYWSSSSSAQSVHNAYNLYFGWSELSLATEQSYRSKGYSVRLVRSL